LGDFAAALEQNVRAREIREALAAEFPLNADFRRTVSVSFYNEGEILGRMGRNREALASYRNDLAIAERLMAADPKNEQYRGDVAYAQIRVGDMLVRLGDPNDALASYHASMTLRGADVQADPGNLWKRSSLIEAHAKTAKALALLGRRDDALAEARSTQALMNGTTVPTEDAGIRGFFADTYADLGDVHATLALCGSARALYRSGLDIWRDMATRKVLSAADANKPQDVERRMRGCGGPM
jgi:tetratricopeptide (TPR) repeat protein